MENPEEIIISKGDAYGALIMSCVQTHKIFCEKIKEEPDASVAMELYCRDVGFLLNMLDRAGEQIHKMRQNRIIT